MDARKLTAWALASCLLANCKSDKPDSTSGKNGSGGSGANGGSSGSGGNAASGGASGTGGSSGANAGGGASGSSGMAGAGAAGSDGGSSPSAGCGKPNPATGERQMQVAGMTGLYIVSIPPNYDPAHAYPLGFGFHGRDRDHQNCRDGDCAGFQREIGGDHVLVYMQSLRTPTSNTMGGWESADEREGNVAFFEGVLAVLKAEYCIDQRRVIVAGTSSGASFSNLLGCRLGDQLLAIAPVSGGLPENTNCRGKPSAVVIHGIDDPHVTFQSGERARDFFRQQAGCSSSTVPGIATMHADVRAARDARPTVEKSGCVDYQGCGAGSSIRWCEHSYGGYDGSTHGWPPNGGKLIKDFVTAR